jgi:hypothetical protein
MVNVQTNINQHENMNITKQLAGAFLAAALCGGAASVHAATTHNIAAITSGNWNDKGVRGGTNYQIGFSTELPNEQCAFFEFDLDSVKGKTVTSAGVLIPGSTDYNITAYWGNPDNGNPSHTQFKVGVSPQGSDTLSQVLTGNNSTTIYLNGGGDANRNADLGYEWVADGLHKGEVFDCFHYTNSRFQTEVNAGGNWIMWSSDRYDLMQNGQLGAENYIWGNTSFNTGIILEITTSN